MKISSESIVLTFKRAKTCRFTNALVDTVDILMGKRMRMLINDSSLHANFDLDGTFINIKWNILEFNGSYYLVLCCEIQGERIDIGLHCRLGNIMAKRMVDHKIYQVMHKQIGTIRALIHALGENDVRTVFSLMEKVKNMKQK